MEVTDGGNGSTRTSEGRVLRPMDPNQARYYAMILRAIADLLQAGEPVCWGWFYAAVEGQPTTVSISIEGTHLCDAELAVRRRVAAEDPDYLIRVEPRAPSRMPFFPRVH